MTNGYDVIRTMIWTLSLLVCAIIYKSEILNSMPVLKYFFLRGREFSAFGISIKVDAPNQQKIADLTFRQDAGGSLKDIPGLSRTKAIEGVERELHEALKHITEDANPVDVLVRNLAGARLEALFGLIYAGIFGSQINGLIRLNPHRRVKNSEAFSFFQPYENAEPDFYRDYGFSGWLKYLISHKLVAQEKEEIVITDFGEDFLTWMIEKRLPINKPH